MIKNIHNVKSIDRCLDRGTSGRMDWLGVWDSNGIAMGDAGHRVGFTRALWNTFGAYATGLLSANPSGGWAAPDWTAGNSGGIDPAVAGAVQPAWLEEYRLGTRGTDEFANYWFNSSWLGTAPGVPSFSTIASIAGDATAQFDGTVGSPLNKDNVLRWHIAYATYSTGAGGVFYPTMRRSFTLDSVGSTTPAIVTTTGVDALVDMYIDALPITPQGVARRSFASVECQTGMNFAALVPTGPICILHTRYENPDRVTGVSYGGVLYQGGMSTRQAVLSVRAATQKSLGYHLSQMTRLQNVPKAERVIGFHVLQGQNDTNDVGPGGEARMSLGPNPAPSNTPEGCADNHHALFLDLRAAWVAEGFDPRNIFHLWGPYHPQGFSRRAWGGRVDDCLRRLSDQLETVAVAPRDEVITSTAVFAFNNWYDAGAPNDAHLTDRAAYCGWAEIAVDAMFPRPRVAITAPHATIAAYYLLYNSAGRVWDDIAKGWQNYDGANFARYAITMAQNGASGRWVGRLPIEVRAAGNYRATCYARAGGAAAEADAVIPGAEDVPIRFDGLRDRDEAASENADRIAGVSEVVAAAIADPGSGSGDVSIDHDGGAGVTVGGLPSAPDVLMVEDELGNPVDDAEVVAFRKTDYLADRRGVRQMQGYTRTDSDGRWVNPINVNPGTYILEIRRKGRTTGSVEVVVPPPDNFVSYPPVEVP
jgi:hypothetical protein